MCRNGCACPVLCQVGAAVSHRMPLGWAHHWKVCAVGREWAMGGVLGAAPFKELGKKPLKEQGEQAVERQGDSKRQLSPQRRRLQCQMPQGLKSILNKGFTRESWKRLGAGGDVGCRNYKIPVKSKHSTLCQRSKR